MTVGARALLAAKRTVFTKMALLLWLGMLAATQSFAQTNEPQILFLHLKVTTQNVVLVEGTVRPGVLKPAPEADSTGLLYELQSADGARLWSGSMPDPNVLEVESEDPPHSGQLRRKAIPRTEAEITIRVPFTTAAERIQFYKLESEAGVKAEKPAKKVLATIPLRDNPKVRQ
jgi:hypothetical protein